MTSPDIKQANIDAIRQGLKKLQPPDYQTPITLLIPPLSAQADLILGSISRQTFEELTQPTSAELRMYTLTGQSPLYVQTSVFRTRSSYPLAERLDRLDEPNEFNTRLDTTYPFENFGLATGLLESTETILSLTAAPSGTTHILIDNSRTGWTTRQAIKHTYTPDPHDPRKFTKLFTRED